MELARVIKSTGSWYLILDEKGNIFKARTVGKLRLDDLKLTNPVAVGDTVSFQKIDENNDSPVNIVKIHPRQNYIVRQSPRKKHFLHLLAANIDQCVLIVTIIHPSLKQGFIDRFLMMTEPHDIPVTILYNKKDLYGDKAMESYYQWSQIYNDIGYNNMLFSAFDPKDTRKLKDLIRYKTKLFSGQSGVGKSTIINQFSKDFDIKANELSSYSGKGQHTTSFAEMYSIENDTFLIDTPGIKTLSFNHYEVMDVSHNFKELFIHSKECKFSNCTHRNEPKCAVKTAIENGLISMARYQNYLQIISEIEDQNYWERLKDL